MARSMLSLGMLAAFALRMTVRRRGLASGSPPPWRAEMLISLISLVNIWPRLASAAPFLCLIVCHLLWPDMVGYLLWISRGIATMTIPRLGRPRQEPAGPRRSGSCVLPSVCKTELQTQGSVDVLHV